MNIYLEVLLPYFNYLIPTILLFVLLNFRTKGALVSIAKVQVSRGKKVLVQIRNHADTYISSAVMGDMGATLTINKDKHIITPKPEDFYRFWGTPIFSYDVVTKVIITPNNTVIQALDPVKASYLFDRALNLGRMSAQNKEKLIMLGMIILIALCGFIAFTMFKQGNDILIMKEAVLATKDSVANIVSSQVI